MGYGRGAHTVGNTAPEVPLGVKILPLNESHDVGVTRTSCSQKGASPGSSEGGDESRTETDSEYN